MTGSLWAPGACEAWIRVMGSAHAGTCFCGAVAIEVIGLPEEMGYCHCNSCRTYSGGAVSPFTLWRQENVRLTKGAALVGRFQKTEMSVRCFCTQCGGHVMVEHPSLGFTDVYAALVPTVAFRPSLHLNYAETVLPMRDGLPKFRDFPAESGGSGETMPE